MKKLYFLAVLSALVLLYSGCVVENEEPPRPVVLEISKQPTKVSYEKGEKLNLNGLEVKLYKTDGSFEVLKEGKYTAEPKEGTVLAEPGETTVKITAEGLSKTFPITVAAPEEKPDVSAGELVISKKPAKVEYKKDEPLDLSGLEVTLKKSDGTSEVLEKGKYTAVPAEGTVLAEPGEKTVRITAEGLSATFPITVAAPEEKPDVSAVELVISKKPAKVEYKKDEPLDLSGLEVTLKKSDGTSEVLTQYTTEPENRSPLTEPGETTVTITAEGLSATFTITVTEPEEKPDVSAGELVISKKPAKVEYKKGDELDLSGLEVTLKKSDGTSEVLTQYTTEPENRSPLTEPGETTVTITAEGLSATFTITVAAPEEKPDVSAGELVISKKPAKVEYKKGDELDLSGLEITLRKTDGTSEVLEEGRYTAEPEEGTGLTEPGEKTVRITAEGLSATFTITVAAPEEKPDVSAGELVISKQPTKVSYEKGDKLDLSGLEITLRKTDGTSEVLEEGRYTAEPEEGTELTEPGEKTVRITAEGLSATFTITVAAPEEKPDVSAGELVISKQPTKVSYEKGDKLDLSGLEITLRKTDGTSEVLEEGRYTAEPEEGTELTEPGEKTVRITAEGLSAPFDICVAGLEISQLPKTAYTFYVPLDLSGLEVKRYNTDGTSKVLEQYTTEPKNKSILTKIGKLTVTITAEGLTETFEISVSDEYIAYGDENGELALVDETGSVRVHKYWGLSQEDYYTIVKTVHKIKVDGKVKKIGAYAFSDDNEGPYLCNLTAVEIPSSVTSIGYAAFKGCSGLTSVEIPSGVTFIGNDAFCGCSGLTSVKIPSGVTSIREGVFWHCSGLTSVEIPSSVTSIGNDAFLRCSGLTSVEIPGSVTSIGNAAFYGCSGLTSVEIPGSVTSIGNSAFKWCRNLASVEISSGVTSIRGCAFEGCSLTSVEIPSSVTSIGYGAFYECSVLTLVKIPSSVTSIGEYAFSECSGLTSVNYGGSKNQWNKITVVNQEDSRLGTMSDKEFASRVGLKGKKIVCTDGEIQY